MTFEESLSLDDSCHNLEKKMYSHENGLCDVY